MVIFMIYLDAAATTFQKPMGVAQAVTRAMRTMSSPGRGSYPNARAADETLFRCRELAGELFGVPSAEQVVFTMNATHALNIAIKTLIKPGSRVAVSGYEHNAVTRPLHALGAEVIVADSPLFDQKTALRGFERALDNGVEAVICTHVSNVFGFVLPIEAIAARCCSARVPLIIDASQSAGVLPINLEKLGAAFIAMPGHKGLYGPQGTGLLLCNHEVQPFVEGGTGSESLIQDMPAFLPDRLEAGTHNVSGIAGLEAGLRFVRDTGIERIRKHERRLLELACKQLQKLCPVRFFYTPNAALQTGVLSLTVKERECFEVSEALAARGIAVRSGLQCAPFAHRTAGTLPDGTVRVSFSAFNRASEVETFVRVLQSVL